MWLPSPLSFHTSNKCIHSAFQARQDTKARDGRQRRREPWRAAHQLREAQEVRLKMYKKTTARPLLNTAAPARPAPLCPTRLAALEQQARSAAARSGAGMAHAASSPSSRQGSPLRSSGGAGSKSGRRSSLGTSGGGGGGSLAGSGARSDRQQLQQQQQQDPPEPLYRRLDQTIAAGPAAEALQLPRPEANAQVGRCLLPCCNIDAFVRWGC